MKLRLGFSKSIVFFPIVSRVIMLCEGTTFSHAYIRLHSDSLDRYLIYQATGSGVYFIGEVSFNEHHKVMEEFEIDITTEAKVKLLQWAIDSSGKTYSRLQFVGMGIKRLAKLFGFNIKNPFGDGNKGYVCTELVAVATEHLGFKLPFDQDSAGLTELHDYVSSIAKKAY